MKTHLIKELSQGGGCGENYRLYAITTIHSGKTEVVLDFTISKRFPIQEIEKAEAMKDKLTACGGRRIYDLEEIANQELVNIKTNR